jgi:hypothetical protein
VEPRKYFQANPQSPIHDALAALVCNSFLTTALAQPRIWVFGHESALAAMTSGP